MASSFINDGLAPGMRQARTDLLSVERRRVLAMHDQTCPESAAAKMLSDAEFVKLRCCSLRKCFCFRVAAREMEMTGGTGEFRKVKKHSPPDWNHRGLVLKATRTVALSPEIKEGLIHHHNPTSQTKLLLFLFGFLFGFLLSCHRHLLSEFHLGGS